MASGYTMKAATNFMTGRSAVPTSDMDPPESYSYRDQYPNTGTVEVFADEDAPHDVEFAPPFYSNGSVVSNNGASSSPSNSNNNSSTSNNEDHHQTSSIGGIFGMGASPIWTDQQFQRSTQKMTSDDMDFADHVFKLEARTRKSRRRVIALMCGFILYTILVVCITSFFTERGNKGGPVKDPTADLDSHSTSSKNPSKNNKLTDDDFFVDTNNNDGLGPSDGGDTDNNSNNNSGGDAGAGDDNNSNNDDGLLDQLSGGLDLSTGDDVFNTDDGDVGGDDGGDYPTDDFFVAPDVDPVENDAYELITEDFVAEIECDLFHYRHIKTGAGVVTLVPVDKSQDKTFGLSIKTPAENNKGTANVLLHSLMDGSDAYPGVHEPIEVLRESSLATHLDAKIQHDRSVFTGATRDAQDFQNIMAVYLDAIFQPSFRKEGFSYIFAQEAWRLEQDKSNSSNYFFNGNTLNEQRSRYSDQDTIIKTYIHQTLFNSSSYQYDNFGSPQDMLDLTLNDITHYYLKYYHPSNMQVFLFGDTNDISAGLDQFNKYAQNFDANPDIASYSNVNFEGKDTDIKNVPIIRRPFPTNVENAEDDDSTVVVSWVINNSTLEPKQQIAWRMLDWMLVQSDAGYIRKRLENFNSWGKEFVSFGLRTDMKQWTFSVGMKGLQSGLVRRAQKGFVDAMRSVEVHGFHFDDIRASFNAVEFQLRDYSTGEVPRGVELFNRLLSVWTYDRDPKEAWEYIDGLQELVREVQNNGSGFLTRLMVDGLMNNYHRTVVEMYPDATFDGFLNEPESQRIQKLKQSLPSEEWFDLLNMTAAVHQESSKTDSAEALAKIPQLDPGQLSVVIPPNTINVTTTDEQITVAKTQVVSSFDMVFIDFGLDLGNVDFEDAVWLPILERLIFDSGTSRFSEKELDLNIALHSGGMFGETMIENVVPKSDADPYTVSDGQHFTTKFFIRGRTIPEQVPDYLSLLHEVVFNSTDAFPKKRVKLILGEIIAAIEEDLIRQPHEYAAMRLQSRFSLVDYAKEHIYGIDALTSLKDVQQLVEDQWDKVSASLQRVWTAINTGHRNGMILNVVAAPDDLDDADPHIAAFIKELIPANSNAKPFKTPNDNSHPWVKSLQTKIKSRTSTTINEGFSIPKQVGCVAQAGQLVPTLQVAKGSMAVVAKWLQEGYLWRKVVELGGSREVTCRFDFRSGTLTFVSHADASLASTMDAFQKVIDDVGQQILASDDLPPDATEAIIGAVAELHGVAPQPNEIGWEFLKLYLRGESQDFTKEWQDQILSTNRQDFVDFATLLQKIRDVSVVAVASSKEFDKMKKDNPKVELTLTQLGIETP